MKTIKEKAEEYALEVTKKHHSDIHSLRAKFEFVTIKNDFILGAKFVQRWIPVEEELPKTGQLVLIKNKEGDISTARYCENLKSKFAIDFDEISDKNVTHWRPIEFE
jgi:5,10-methenyltetrahydromethanopterin hydrogenase